MRFAGIVAPLLLILMLGACAEQRPGPPPACEPAKQYRDPRTALPGRDYAANIATLVYGEWDRFGRQTWRFAATDAKGHEVRHGVREMERPDWVQAYWRSVSWTVPVDQISVQPWSAVFVSWVMIQAGVPTATFCGHAAHSAYLETLWKNQQRNPDTPFVLRHHLEAIPQPGDLVCAARRPTDRAPVSEISIGHFRRPAGNFLASHCDIVVRVDRARGILEAIGGNVADSVTMSVFDIDASGRLAAPSGGDSEGARPWFAVVENRYARRQR